MSIVVPSDQLLSFSVGPYILCVNADEVVANMEPPVIARMPLTPAYALGAFFYQDEVAAAIDLRQKFDLPMENNQRSQLIISQTKNRKFIAVQVDEIYDYIDGSSLRWKAMKHDEPDHPFLMQCERDGLPLIFSSLELLFLFRQGQAVVIESNKLDCTDDQVEVEENSTPLIEEADSEKKVLPTEAKKSVVDNVIPFPSASEVSSQINTRPIVTQPMERKRITAAPSVVYVDVERHFIVRYWLLATVVTLAITLVVAVQLLKDEESVIGEPVFVAQKKEPDAIVIDTPKLRIEVHSKSIASTAQSVQPQFVHQVVSGDTLWNIAQTYLGDPYQFPELAKTNGIKDPDLIYPGNIVKIYTK